MTRNTVAFTICAANYLHHAITLGNAIHQHDSDVLFIIGLVDDQPPSAVDAANGHKVISWSELRAAGYEAVSGEYGIIEFCTAVKPLYFTYLMRMYPDISRFYYIDPDIRFYHSFDALDALLVDANVLLTPHATTPQEATHSIITPEQRFLLRGVFNLGFIGLRRSDETSKLLAWWGDRLRQHCRLTPEEGLFVDQKWMDLVPCYFGNVHVLRHPGCNIAYWNLYERTLTRSDRGYLVNGQPLMFYHFSAVDRLNPTATIARYASLGYGGYDALEALHMEYVRELRDNGMQEYGRLAWMRPDGPQVVRRSGILGKIVSRLTR